ncbi:MAG: cytidylate kinase family protein [archaeon]
MKEKTVIVSGFSGSGKSNLVECIAKKFNLKCIHTSALLREIIENHSTELSKENNVGNKGWWESSKGKKMIEERLIQTEYDKLLDKKLLELIEEGSIAMDSWTMGYLSNKGFKIWLSASAETRAKRISKRNNQPLDKVLEAIKSKEEKTTEIYKKLYGFTLGENLEKFNLVIDTEGISEKQVQKIALKELKEKYFQKD